MITYIDSNNSERYKILFDNASDLLNKNIVKEEDKVQITTLEEYFYYLPTLITKKGQSTDNEDDPYQYNNLFGRRYTILPLDEEHFKIDANSRIIQVPTVFRKNGIAVQGDQVAEVVYFKINRYFDFMDLNNTHILIQWKVDGIDPSENNKPVTNSGTSMEWVRDIESQPEYLIFGWALDSEITKYPGTLTFSIRFIKLNPQDTPDDGIEDGSIEYSFSTLDASAIINKALSQEVTLSKLNTWKQDNEAINKTISTRIKSSKMLGAEIAEPPTFTLTIGDWVKQQEKADNYIYTVNLVGNTYYPNKFYFYNTDKGQYELAKQAYNKTLQYYKKIEYTKVNVTAEDYDPTNLFVEDKDNVGEYESAPDTFDDSLTYFEKMAQPQYEQVALSTGEYLFKVKAKSVKGAISYNWYDNGKQIQDIENEIYLPVVEGEINATNQWFTPVSGTIYYVRINGEFDIPDNYNFGTGDRSDQIDLSKAMLYERFGGYVATQAGTYYATATNTLKGSSTTFPDPLEKNKNLTTPDVYGPITIPFPETTTFNQGSRTHLSGNNSYQVVLNANPKNDSKDYYILNWYKDGVALQDQQEETITIKGVPINEYNPEQDVQGVYKLKATAWRNNAYKEDFSSEYIVTYNPSPIETIELKDKDKDRTLTQGQKIYVGTKVTATPKLQYNYQKEDQTAISYQWYYETSRTTENNGIIDSIFDKIPDANESTYTLEGSITINNTSISLLNRQIYCEITNNYNQSGENSIIKDSIRIEIVANSDDN